MLRISHKPRIDNRPYRRSTASEEISFLKAAMRMMEILESHPRLVSVSRPVLWHTDLHLGNIYIDISEDDHPRIASIIDWQSISVGPLFLQANWPEFLRPPSEDDVYVRGVVQPRLPDNFGELDAAEKKLATSTRDEAIITKAYELRSALYNNRDVYRSLNLPSVFRETFIRCGEACEEGTIALRACLVELYQNWNALGCSGSCPVSFAAEEDEILKQQQEFQEYRVWHEVQEFARNYLDTDADGWISPELDFAGIQQRNKAALDRYVAAMSKEMSPEQARMMWPFSEGV
jgi:hypothetical protein